MHNWPNTGPPSTATFWQLLQPARELFLEKKEERMGKMSGLQLGDINHVHPLAENFLATQVISAWSRMTSSHPGGIALFGAGLTRCDPHQLHHPHDIRKWPQPARRRLSLPRASFAVAIPTINSSCLALFLRQ